MKIFLQCLPCFLKQVLEAADMATGNEEIKKKIMKEAIREIANFENFRHSPEMGRHLHDIVKKHTGSKDPYKEIKERNIEAALKLYPSLKSFLSQKEDKLLWGLKIAATGNIMDSAIYSDLDIEKVVMDELSKPFSICVVDKLRQRMEKAKTMVILGDNVGETVFDRVFTEELKGISIYYAVRSEPIINDTTLDEAQRSGLDLSTTVISSGCSAPGFIPEEGSYRFMKIFNNADVVISKGQGNYESLSDHPREIFFLLKAKCPAIASSLGVDTGEYVFK
jgi:damage-control phosphatase, subfamily I